MENQPVNMNTQAPTVNLDAWRVNRSKVNRQDDEMIDHLCAMLVQYQQKLQELEAKAAAPVVES